MARQSLKNIHRLIEIATNELPVEQSFVADINAAIEKLDEKDRKSPSKSYKPSSMSCIRNMYYQISGEPQEGDRSNACLVGICESGSDRHERLQEAISKMKSVGIDCEYVDVEDYIENNKIQGLKVVKKQGFETKLFHNDLNMSFMCDGIIKYKGEHYILEIKTETIYKWQSRSGVAEEHIPQGTAYATCLELNKVMFLYENRDNCDKKAYVLEVTDEMKLTNVISKIEECDGYVKRFIVPPKPENLDRRTCTYCSYKTACRRDGA